MKPKHFAALTVITVFAVALALTTFATQNRWSQAKVSGASLFPGLITQSGKIAKIEIKQGDKTLTVGTFRVDTAKTPHAIDLTTSERDGSKITTLAIYELADGVLRICGAQPGEPRPGEFAAMDGSGYTLTTCERASP